MKHIKYMHINQTFTHLSKLVIKNLECYTQSCIEWELGSLGWGFGGSSGLTCGKSETRCAMRWEDSFLT